MKFTLEIELGNDAMQTQGDVRGALAKVSRRLDYYGTAESVLTVGQYDVICDENGNTVGKWEVTA